MSFQHTIEKYKGFFQSCAAVFLGAAIGITGAKFLQAAINARAVENCPSAKIVTVQDPFIGERLFCIK
jgi:hypothetical protein